jgi:hypothetical protein
MTALTVTNVEYSIAAAMKTAFEDATIDGKRVWETVRIALSEADVSDKYLRQESPVAAIVFDNTTETLTVGNVPAIEAQYTLIFAARLYGDSDDGDRLKEGMRLVNAAKNVIESDLPASPTVQNYVTVWGDENHYQSAFNWGNPEISRPTEEEREPWVVAKLPITVGAVLTSTTTH